MRILVISDSHKNEYNANRAVKAQPTAEIVVHCGDGADDAADIKISYPEKMIVSVKGNCDFAIDRQGVEIFSVEGKKIFVTHGHLYGVKSGLYRLSCAAKEAGADIVLFGHTHQPFELYEDGIYYLNPGTVGGYDGTYGYVDITDSGIITNIVRLNK